MVKLEEFVKENPMLLGVCGVLETEMVSENLQLESITFEFEKFSLVINPVADSDEIDFQIVENRKEKLGVELLGNILNQRLMDIWYSPNSKGYYDLMTLSFDYLIPKLAVYSIGSSLTILELKPLKA